MDELKQSFIDETGNLMKETEENLLLLEENPDNIEVIDAVYRSIHSLKGIAGMFEFNEIADWSHKLENVLSAVKSGHCSFGTEVINLCFLYIDFVKKSVQGQTDDELSAQLKKEFEADISTIIADDDSGKQEQQTLSTYYVLLEPNADFEKRGIKLEAVFSVLEDNGEFKKFEKITSAENMQTKFYMFWEYLIVSQKPLEAITEDLLLEPEEIKAVKISGGDLLSSQSAQKVFSFFDDPTQKADVQTLIKKHGKLEARPHKKTEIVQRNSNIKEDLVKNLSEYEISGISVASEKLDNLMNFVSELISNKEAINIFARQQNNSTFNELLEQLDKTTNNLKDTALSMRLIPLESIMIKFKRLVRDLSKKQNKSVVFETDGTKTELDKTVINMLAEPLMHIIRNSIDHGIESAEERIKAGKPETGRIKLFASHEGSEVVIQIHDDGRGIDPENVRRKAIEKGLLEADRQISKREMLSILFLPGFSTAHEVSSLSGRGIGMDVVKQKITDIRGDIEIDSEPGLGTYVTLKLPMTLSIIETLQVEINGNYYLIPQNVITNVDAITQEAIDTNKKNLIELHGEAVPLVDLTKKFNSSKRKETSGKKRIVSVLYKDRNIGLITDRIIGDHQAVLKPLGELFKNKEAFSGAGILGDGSLALMIDTNKLLKEMKLQYQ